MSRSRIFVSFAGVALLSGLILAMANWQLQPESASEPQKAGARTSGNAAAVARPKAPAEKACLPPPSDVGDDEMAASAGLDPDDVRTVMRGAVQGTLSCFSGASSVTLDLEITVGCNGRVSRVNVENAGDVTPAVESCVSRVLQAASFPAHALPDGDTFNYPLSYNAPG